MTRFASSLFAALKLLTGVKLRCFCYWLASLEFRPVAHDLNGPWNIEMVPSPEGQVSDVRVSLTRALG